MCGLVFFHPVLNRVLAGMGKGLVLEYGNERSASKRSERLRKFD